MPTTADVRFTVNRGGVDRLLHSPDGELGQWLTRIGNRAVNSAKERANVDTGLMRSRIEFTIETDGLSLVGILAAKTNYSWFVHQGARGRSGNPFLMDGLRDALG